MAIRFVILTPRFEATRELFWDGPRNFEPLSDDDTYAVTPSPNFHATPTGGRLATTYELTCKRPHTRRIFSGIGFEAETLPLGHRGLYGYWNRLIKSKQNFSSRYFDGLP
ncbi:hypothetical protein AVEN_258433-1 [Araneus ventricosus]|uniref:Uncharacterized protein n=1 Tax=Araneus ventricosus TaxID=182803 RepID=A0A4Y2DI41_ARAVE|nr:hypothetical protein AVEN_258433-1 [Araneus ventricosus]